MKNKFDFISLGGTDIGLSHSDHKYWRAMLPKIVRIAAEFEFNLMDRVDCLIPADYRRDNACLCSGGLSEGCKPVCLDTSCGLYNKDECFGLHCVAFVSSCRQCTKKKAGNCDACRQVNPFFGNSSARSRDNIIGLLNPAGNVRSPKGVSQVMTDGSLLGEAGVEVTTVAQRVSYDKLYAQYKEIMDATRDNRAFVSERCSVHYHLMTGYVPESGKAGHHQKPGNMVYNDLEDWLPEIICLNNHQLFRRYETALIYMFSTGQSLSNLTRWAKFRQSVLGLKSPTLIGMRALQSEIARWADTASGSSSQSHGKYATVNYYYSRFSDSGDANPLHIEYRFADGHWIPSIAAAQACLMYALLIKAVDISKYGMVMVGSEEEVALRQEITKLLMNNNGSWRSSRVSYTAGIEKYFPVLIDQSKEMLRLTAHILADMGDSLTVLSKLAETPISVLRSKGWSWEEVYNYFEAPTSKHEAIHRFEQEVLKLIDFTTWESNTEDAWINEVANHLGLPIVQITETVTKFKQNYQIRWSKKLGSYVRL